MTHVIASISQRMSLRKPQEDSLGILSRLCNVLPLEKGADMQQCLSSVKEGAGLTHFDDFEHDFPSFCFALATGVGKTRLMGAFISYLFLAEGIRNFFVLSPSLTIYDKLKTDFTPNTSKYVFQGISEFAVSAPVIVTGDNYETGKGVSDVVEMFDTAYINIFNISKINSEVRSGKAPRIKRLSEYIGESYFDYLSKLDDLVLIMDESHRYRADAGMRAINELKPILGLELTATPQVESGGRSIPFKNVVYSYPLSQAMNDGYVKEPAVATRTNFDPNNFDRDSLERLKLEDGIHLHESVKAELEVYARQTGRPYVKPFMLVVAEDTAHAERLLQLVCSEAFFAGRYKGRAITVHSKQRGAEQDEMVQQLLEVENPANPTEIVIHVNKLQEGWDVKNLYTIVPLRAANSKTLVEQSIGRGLRLPYGKRTGKEEVDTLTIVSHDKFQEIIDDARRPDSVIKRGIVIGADIPAQGVRAVTVEPKFISEIPNAKQPEETPADAAIKREFLKVVQQQYERLGSASELLKPEIQLRITEQVRENLAPRQAALPEFDPFKDVARCVSDAARAFSALSIDLPRIVVVPKGEVFAGYRDFELQPPSSRFQPVEEEILIQSLEDEGKRYLKAHSLSEQRKLEDYLVSGLMDFDDVNYDEHAKLLYKLSQQMVDYLRTYLNDDTAVKNVLLYFNKQLVDLIHAQMSEHYEETSAGFEATVSKGFRTMTECNYTLPVGEEARDFRIPVDERSEIRRMLFTGFEKCLFASLKFDSDSERRLACVLESDPEVRRWIRPPDKAFQIYYHHGEEYEPDFVVETENGKFLCEVKRRNDLENSDVIAKRDAAVTWCAHATEATRGHWTYVLIPHDAINESVTFSGLVARFRELKN